MELAAKGDKRFMRILRLAGIPAGDGDTMIIQKGEASPPGKRKAVVRWGT